MVAFAGGDPIGVLIGAKRASGTLVYRIAVHPDHVRQGHGRHLLTSLSSKLAILGPPQLVAEVPEDLLAACELFKACGYAQESFLTDYVRDASPSARLEGARPLGTGWLVIPVTLDDLDANGLGSAEQPRCWERSIETLTARKDELTGLAAASDEGIEAFVLSTNDGAILSLRSVVDDGGARLEHLLSLVGARSMAMLRLPKAHLTEISVELLQALGFSPAGGHRLYAARARSA
jgi:hypothetical protein